MKNLFKNQIFFFAIFALFLPLSVAARSLYDRIPQYDSTQPITLDVSFDDFETDAGFGPGFVSWGIDLFDINGDPIAKTKSVPVDTHSYVFSVVVPGGQFAQARFYGCDFRGDCTYTGRIVEGTGESLISVDQKVSRGFQEQLLFYFWKHTILIVGMAVGLIILSLLFVLKSRFRKHRKKSVKK